MAFWFDAREFLNVLDLKVLFPYGIGLVATAAAQAGWSKLLPI